MKTIVLALLALSSTQAVAADWHRYHVEAVRAIEFFLDLDSLHQTSQGFEGNIRLSVGQGRQEFLGRQTVNCGAATFTLSNLREVRAGTASGENAEVAGLIGNDTAMSALKELYCVRWQEPADVRWKAFASVSGEMFFYDERVEDDHNGANPHNDFHVYLKSMGETKSLLAKVQISCLENRFAILSGVYRDETRGWLANISPGNPQTPAPDSPVALLRARLCAVSDNTGEKSFRGL